MITIDEYKSRRLKLAGSLPDDSVAVIFAASEVIRNGDASYRFRQNSNFYYLTGFNEPDAVLVITSGDNSKSILFNRPLDKAAEQWTGKRLGQENAKISLGFDEAFILADMPMKLLSLLDGCKSIYYFFAEHANWRKYLYPAVIELKNSIRRGVIAPSVFADLEPIISEMRVFKSAAEVELIKKAVSVSVFAHKRAIRKAQDLKYESELEAELLYEMHRNGCQSMAYESIVAAGNNACTLHYIENNQPLKTNSLVLIDAGGEYQNYAADITRAFPVSGRFSEEQKQIYNLVLRAQRTGIELIRPGCFWNEIQNAILKVLTTGLVELGILSGNIDNLIKQEAYKPFYMHGSGHYLGLDVHDAGQYKIDGNWRKLAAGMVLTVEPGLYFIQGLQNIAEKWQGIGIRIEDDILVTEDGYENLSAGLMV